MILMFRFEHLYDFFKIFKIQNLEGDIYVICFKQYLRELADMSLFLMAKRGK